MSVTNKNNCDAVVRTGTPDPISAPLTSNDGAALGAQSRQPGLGPRRVREIENIWIPMSDGTKIAARMWLPEDAEESPVPALMEYIPYRKRENTSGMYPYLASYGYACVRPDIRGSGDSEGLPQDEYVKQEQDDGVEIIAWLARQPWCTGKVGMFGISWGGFSALQVAARRPAELKAIITVCSTDDRYADDAHYPGGLIEQDMLTAGWGVRWPAYDCLSPDPAIVGDRWRDMWMKRLNKCGLLPREVAYPPASRCILEAWIDQRKLWCH